ncbi:hypothetical protein AAGT00_29210 [Streptomyces cavourensis]
MFVGAALVAIPVLLMGSANDEEPRNNPAPVAGSADTVLNPGSAPAALDDYVMVKPTPSPTEQKKVTPPKAAPAPEPRTSAPPKPTPTPSRSRRRSPSRNRSRSPSPRRPRSRTGAP